MTIFYMTGTKTIKSIRIGFTDSFIQAGHWQTQGFTPDLGDGEYVKALQNAMQNRVDAVEGFDAKKEGYDKLPDEALAALKKIVDEAASL